MRRAGRGRADAAWLGVSGRGWWRVEEASQRWQGSARYGRARAGRSSQVRRDVVRKLGGVGSSGWGRGERGG